MAAGGSQGSSVARQRLGKVLLLVGSLGLSLVAGEFVVRLWEAKQENQVRPAKQERQAIQVLMVKRAPPVKQEQQAQ